MNFWAVLECKAILKEFETTLKLYYIIWKCGEIVTEFEASPKTWSTVLEYQGILHRVWKNLKLF